MLFIGWFVGDVGDRLELAFIIKATVPDTTGVAIDVPLKVP